MIEPSDTPLRVIIYTRQSLTKDEDDSLSLDFQEGECRRHATRNGWCVLEPVISDPDVRGWDPNRPGIAELLKRIERERPDIVLVYAMSRFARDYILQELTWRQIRERGARLVSVHEPNAEDDLVRGILGVVSQAERKRMGAFLSSAFRERARRGYHHGKVPFGYQKAASGKLTIDPDAAPYVERMVRWKEEGWSNWRIAKELNRTMPGGRTFEPNVVRNVLRSPVIAGGVKTADVLTWEAHEPIIDRDRWERLQQLLDEKRVIRTKKAHSWLEGLLICGCGAPMHLSYAKAYRSEKENNQFRCSAAPWNERFQRPRAFPECSYRPRSILQTKAERLTIAALCAALPHALDAETVHRHLLTQYQRQDRNADRERAALTKAREQATKERDRLLVLYRRGSLDVERWEAEDGEISARIAALDDALAALPVPPDRDRIEQTSAELRAIADGLDEIARHAPERFRDVLLVTRARVQRTPDGVRIAWPRELAPFFAESFLEEERAADD